jgi:hypothetical protein
MKMSKLKACENETRELMVDELDFVTGGLGGTLGQAVEQIGDGLLHAVGRAVVQILTGLKEAERNRC